MNAQIKSQRRRVSSARPVSATNHQRPHSGTTFLRKQLIQSTYNGHTQPARTASAKTLTVKQASTLYDSGKLKRGDPKISKQKEQLAEEIVSLKLKINGLVRDLGHQRGKTEQIRKKHNKFARVLNVQFQNERVWNAGIINTHKVQGMRNMYDRIKEENDFLREEYERLQRTVKVTKELEYIKYIEVLEDEIKSFHRRFDRIGQYSLELLNHEGDHQKEANMHMLGEFQLQNEQLSERYHKLKSKYQMSNENLKDRNKKIQFLEKYNRDLENKVHQMDKAIVGKDRQIKRNEEEISGLREEYGNYKDNSENDVAILKLELEQDREGFSLERGKLMTEKEHQIAGLRKENCYYQDMIKELRRTNNQISKELQHLKSHQNASNVTKKLVEKVFAPEKAKTPKPSRDHDENSQKFHQGASALFIGKRVRQTADQKYSETSLKKRRVKQSEIDQAAQMLRLYFIGESIPLSTVLQTIEYKSDPQLSDPQNTWLQQHITMRQMKDILKRQPFKLPEQTAELLARYIVEDVQQQFVYVDEDNENYRNIVKSIFKNLFGEYLVIKGNESLAAEIQLFFERYEVNLSSVLASIAPNGKVARRRFMDTLRSLGVEYSDDLLQALLGTMAVQASSLEQLNYATLFKRFGQQ